jgi:hypothetical protein
MLSVKETRRVRHKWLRSPAMVEGGRQKAAQKAADVRD